jgi:hypothetical protein
VSRYSGLWVGLKCAGETVGSTATVDLGDLATSYVLPGSGAPAVRENRPFGGSDLSISS